jgi:hypothetical protein
MNIPQGVAYMPGRPPHKDKLQMTPEQQAEKEQVQEEVRLRRLKAKEKTEKERKRVADKLQAGKQVGVSHSKHLSHENLAAAFRNNAPVIFLLEKKITSSPLVIISMNINERTGIVMALKDGTGARYEVFCYKINGGPGYIKKIVS